MLPTHTHRHTHAPQILFHVNWMGKYEAYCQQQQRGKNENPATALWPPSSGHHAHFHPGCTSLTLSTGATINSSPAEFIWGSCKFQSPDLIKWQFVQRDKRGQENHPVICKSSCIHLAFIRRVINRPPSSGSGEQTVSAWPLTLPAECVAASHSTQKMSRANTNTKAAELQRQD